MTSDEPPSPVRVTLLGTGGPFANPRRASSSLLVQHGSTNVLVDCGGGAFERLGRAGVDPARLDAILITHTHADHTGDIAAVVFAATMAGGATPMRIIGPTGREQHPGITRFTQLLFGTEGAWSYLHTFDGFAIDALELPADPDHPAGHSPITIGSATIRSMPVRHGMMPSLAYQIDIAGRRIVISGDVQERSELIERAAHRCDLLIHDLALPQRTTEHGHLHAKPTDIGELAASAQPGRLVLTHVMPELENELPEALQHITNSWDGPVHVANDMDVITLTTAAP